ncbi:unnamed protein product [Chondrus crispus]|uniref:Uncharacterized protein n=1 Tax=Chondrus crispus TaxID=2769 RepID=R7Q256_CHOCR|nr:unnamed protein product [Chondrus crispus]CDF32139.1 unnamed protein product [Chondrus crispus]|eukprot:XP_005711804.1 unnamed protein product [Chondrus crispus]
MYFSVSQRVSAVSLLSSRKSQLHSAYKVRHQLQAYVLRSAPVSRRSQCSQQNATIRMADDSTEVSLPIKIGALLVVAGFIITAFLPAAGVIKNALTDNGDNVVDYQLSKVPVFTVTDASGRPFLSETEDHRSRLGYFFIQPADAELFLNRVKNENADAKVLTVGLNEAVKYLDSKPRSSKSIPETFSLFPDEHESQIAQDITDGAFQRNFGPSGVPIFYVDGLALKEDKEGQAIIPLFFEKEKLDETLETLKKQSPEIVIEMKDLQVIDLNQTIKEIRTGGNPKFNRIAFKNYFIPVIPDVLHMSSPRACFNHSTLYLGKR